MGTRATYPRIPTADILQDQKLRSILHPLRETMLILVGQTGDILQQGVIKGDLVNLGLAQVKNRGTRYVGLFNPLRPEPEPFTSISITDAGGSSSSGFSNVVITAANSPYTITDVDQVLFCNTNAGAITATLPAGTDRRWIRLINVGSAGNDVTLNPDGTELLNGVNSSETISDEEILIEVYESSLTGWW